MGNLRNYLIHTCWLAISLLVISCAKPYDILITSGRIIDGTGNPGYPADIAIKDGKIARIGKLDANLAKRVIDATNLIVTPGFIDMHTHTDRKILAIPDVQNYIRQGVTTVVAGNCGGSPLPVGEFLSKLEKTGSSLNFALLVGHNTVRRKVMGRVDRLASPDELGQMEQLVEAAMKEGAFGMSTGLKYIPGTYANTAEVVALATIVGSYGGFYATHMREEGRGLLESIEESINIGEQAQLPVQISHFKVVGKPMWGSSLKILAMIDEAASRGLDITADQYPYIATSTGLTIIFPAWSLEGGRSELKKRLDDPATRTRIKKAIEDNILFDRGGGDPASIVVSGYKLDTSLEGKNLTQITVEKGLEPTIANAVETVMDLVYDEGGQAIYFCLNEDDVKRIMSHPRVMIASDGSTIEFGIAKPHPRNYGTYPRVLGTYVREQNALGLEDAIRKMTSLPAQRLNLQDRGLLKVGMWADIAIINPNDVADRATWTEPHQYAQGIPYVLVNGIPVIDDNDWTGNYAGEVLYGPGK